MIKVRFVAFFITLSLLLSGLANAEWVYLGRKALRNLRQLTSDTEGRTARLDVATVLLKLKNGFKALL